MSVPACRSPRRSTNDRAVPAATARSCRGSASNGAWPTHLRASAPAGWDRRSHPHPLGLHDLLDQLEEPVAILRLDLLEGANTHRSADLRHLRLVPGVEQVAHSAQRDLLSLGTSATAAAKAK